MSRRSTLLAAVAGLSVLAGLVSACAGDTAPSDTISSPNATVREITVAEITVAAASDLRPAFDDLGASFTARTGTKVTFSYGSSGQLRTQILNGAPFDLFASASTAFVDEIISAGRGRVGTRADYAYGRIVLWTSDAATRPAKVEDLGSSRFARIAIANPEHAPYGLAAVQALKSAGVFDRVKARLVFGENISDTFRIARSGNADVGIIALSLAIADGTPYTLIPSTLHEPLQQTLVVTGDGERGDAAVAFAAHVNSPEGRQVMIRYGFTLPGEQATT